MCLCYVIAFRLVTCIVLTFNVYLVLSCVYPGWQARPHEGPPRDGRRRCSLIRSSRQTRLVLVRLFSVSDVTLIRQRKQLHQSRFACQMHCSKALSVLWCPSHMITRIAMHGWQELERCDGAIPVSVCEQKHTFLLSPCLAIPQQKLLSSPLSGAPQAYANSRFLRSMSVVVFVHRRRCGSPAVCPRD